MAIKIKAKPSEEGSAKSEHAKAKGIGRLKPQMASEPEVKDADAIIDDLATETTEAETNDRLSSKARVHRLITNLWKPRIIKSHRTASVITPESIEDCET